MITGVGTPVGVVGNAIVVVARRVIRSIPPRLGSLLVDNLDNAQAFLRYVGTYVRNPTP